MGEQEKDLGVRTRCGEGMLLLLICQKHHASKPTIVVVLYTSFLLTFFVC